MKHIENLLNQIKIVTDKNAEIIEATGGRFNMFQICGVNHYEKTHSAILAEFLNPKGSHGLKSKFLECFIETLEEKFSIKNFNCENAIVATEKYFDTGNIDILIEDNHSKAMIIENKIYADDQWEQLKRYDSSAKNKYKTEDYQIFYLTLDGTEASEQSGEGVEYHAISYRETIIEWLEKCVAIAVRYPMVRETINQYIIHLKQLTNQDMDTKCKEEKLEILVKNFEAAQAIYQITHDEFLDALSKKYFVPAMQQYFGENRFEYERSNVEFGGINFKIKVPKWKKCVIYFWSGRAGYYYGAYYLNTDNTLSDEILNKIKMRVLNSGHSTWWACEIKINKIDWKTVVNGTFAEDCKSKINQLIRDLEGIEL